jgi:hypothetical protein
MKKLFFSLFVFSSVTSLCFAQQAQTPVNKPMVSQTVKTSIGNKSLTGRVDSVTIGDVAQGAESVLVVVVDEGQKLNFVVKNGTSITNKEAKTVALSDMKKGDKVVVAYTMNEMGMHKAQSIKLVE